MPGPVVRRPRRAAARRSRGSRSRRRRGSAARRRRSAPPRPACRTKSGSRALRARARCRAPRRSCGPSTNCWPRRRIARSTPLRISGSPPLRNSDASACSSVPSLRESTSLPVTSSPHAAALTNSDGLRPTCARQSPWPILSRIRRSRVAASGMRSSASARHMSAMPSRESSENSSISASTPPAFWRSARTPSASLAASACVGAQRRGRERGLLDQRSRRRRARGGDSRRRCARASGRESGLRRLSRYQSVPCQ